VLGLLAAPPRKNCWTTAEHGGDAIPDGMQHLLARARWDTDGVRDDLRSFVAGHSCDPDAVLVADETGDLKKASPQPACSASTPARPGGSKTHRSQSALAAPPRPVMR
jgi:hypothetical protein